MAFEGNRGRRTAGSISTAATSLPYEIVECTNLEVVFVSSAQAFE